MERGCYVYRAEAERMTFAEHLDRYAKEVLPRHKGCRRKLWKNRNVVIPRDKIAKYSSVDLTLMLAADYRDRQLQMV